jgi:hypothetical protein
VHCEEVTRDKCNAVYIGDAERYTYRSTGVSGRWSIRGAWRRADTRVGEQPAAPFPVSCRHLGVYRGRTQNRRWEALDFTPALASFRLCVLACSIVLRPWGAGAP